MCLFIFSYKNMFVTNYLQVRSLAISLLDLDHLLFYFAGIIRKTRTVMECLHRFCRDCIDKSMRLGNNECPACRTHCASRRSLRDDPNYDALIAALYPDIDKYEEEEFAFSEQERIQNKKIQETIEETFRRQSDAIGKKRSMAKATATAFARKYRRTRGRVRTIPPDITPTGSSEEERGEGNSKE
ncbi:Putative E3 ubiquitin-protein ligase RING1a, partial [Zea mays]